MVVISEQILYIFIYLLITYIYFCIFIYFLDNFENYVKGPRAIEVSRDLLGHGIFNSNGEQWRWQRKSASLIFNVKNFRDHFTE